MGYYGAGDGRNGYMDDNGEFVDLGPRSASEADQNRLNMELEAAALEAEAAWERATEQNNR